MNQYEIELRDKFAAMVMEYHFKACINDRSIAPSAPNHLAEMVYNFTDALMIERDEPKKYIIDKVKLAMELVEIAESLNEEIKDICTDHKVSGRCDHARGDYVKIGDEGYGIIDDILIKVRRPDGSIVTQDDRDVHKHIHQETGHKVQGTECNR